jgi:Tol biopolymer transport system component
MQQSAIWIHDSKGDRPISSVGNATLPAFSADGTRIFYLLRRSGPESDHELWEVDVRTGRSERLFAGLPIKSYDIADNGSDAVLAITSAQGKSQIWIASLEQRVAPVQIASDAADAPFFGPDGQIFFRLSDGKANYLYRMNRDGSGRAKVVPYPILNVVSISPNRRWLAALVAVNDGEAKFAEIAISIDGGERKRVCSGYCEARWAPDGRHFYITVDAGTPAHPGNTVPIPIPTGHVLPALPIKGVSSLEQGLSLSGGAVIPHSEFAPGPNPSVYAYVKTSMHRNLFRIPVR